MARTLKRRWQGNPWGRTPRIGEKNGSKRHALVDEHGVPLSLIVSAANTHDSKMIGALLDARVARPANKATVENLCLDAGSVGKADEVSARRAMRKSSVQQTRFAIGFVTRQVTPETPRAHPQQFRRFLLAQTTLIPAFIRFQKTHLPYLFLHEHPFHLNSPWNSQGDTMTTGQLSRYNSGQIGSSLHQKQKTLAYLRKQWQHGMRFN
jgi:hypothetical protein